MKIKVRILSIVFTLFVNTLLLLNFSNNIFAQNVGINVTGTIPDNSAMLDISSSSKGLLIPRVSLTSSTDIITIPSPAVSLLVYNTGTGGHSLLPGFIIGMGLSGFQ